MCARGLALLLGLLCASARTAGAEASLTVMTWNVENYLAEDRVIDGEFRTAFPKPEKAKTALRAAIRAAVPDVLALQEMGPEPYLEELQRDLATEGTAYPYRVLLAGPDPERHVAVLARVPLAQVTPHVEVPVRGAKGDAAQLVRRGVLEVAVALGDRTITLFVVHLKSRYTGDPNDPFSAAQRLGEAEAVRDLVLRRFPRPAEAPFLLLGDCNDAPRSRPVQMLLRRGGTKIAELLPALDANGDGWTHHFRKEDSFSRVDYILVSPGLRPAVIKVWIFDSADVRAASDHRPVLVRLDP
jgi:endonuclease/exonuclease/phosphatase family metal-dependent hydrolase